jgi:pilus assembly protein Flp/PilA
MSLFTAFLKDESGASAAEYILILAVIGGGIAVAAGVLGTSISGALNNAANFINSHATFS